MNELETKINIQDEIKSKIKFIPVKKYEEIFKYLKENFNE